MGTVIEHVGSQAMPQRPLRHVLSHHRRHRIHRCGEITEKRKEKGRVNGGRNDGQKLQVQYGNKISLFSGYIL